jgi:hypothetical protein
VDEPRLLAAKSELGYVNRTAAALPGEPEAVDADTQARFTLEARRERERQQQRAWEQARGKIIDGIEIVGAAKLPKQVFSSVRVIRRQVDRIDRQLRSQP